MLNISVRYLERTTILDITGSIDLANSTELRRVMLTEIREKRTPKVVLNLHGVAYIDSSGIASLVEGLRASRDLHSRLILYGLSPIAREVMRLSKLVTIFEIYETEEMALQA